MRSKLPAGRFATAGARRCGSGGRCTPEASTALARPSLRRVINATGVVLHTNLGRAPLAGIRAGRPYSNLEYDLAAGRRGKRDTHTARAARAAAGAPAIAVNNNAAAVYLALHELAGDGGEVIVSRGELIEIGDGFRIPDIMARSGALLVEVGTTNRTRIDDYRAAITERTRLLLRVHPEQFPHRRASPASPRWRSSAALGRERGIPVYEDLGSGCLVDLRAVGSRRAHCAAKACGQASTWSRSAATSCWADRRRASWPAARTWWRGCAAIRCSARCAWTN